MEAREIRVMTSEEIMNKLDEAYHELFNLRSQFKVGRLKNTNRIIEVKRDIARMKTILRERELYQVLEEGLA